MPGVEELLGSLEPTRWRIVTSSRDEHIRRCVDAARLPIPAVSVFADDVAHAKPAPDGYLVAAQCLGSIRRVVSSSRTLQRPLRRLGRNRGVTAAPRLTAGRRSDRFWAREWASEHRSTGDLTSWTPGATPKPQALLGLSGWARLGSNQRPL